jgi:Lar family restriction alleviation protein
MKINDLLPCPFCSDEIKVGIVKHIIVDGWHKITCTGCGLTTGRHENEEEAILRWNTRCHPLKGV